MGTPGSENKLTVALPAEALAVVGAPAAGSQDGGVSPAGSGAGRLDALAMRLNVRVRVPSFRVRDLLVLEKGMVIETDHEHTQDVPVESGGALLMWAEFEVVDERLAVRITRLA